jgi:hypothetical protein
MAPVDKVQTRSPLTLNMNAATRFAGRRPNQNNVTGNATEYVIPFANGGDLYDTDGTVSAGVFTAPSSGVYAFTGSVRMDGMGASVTLAQLSIVHYAAAPATTQINRAVANLVPNGAINTAGIWRGQVSAFFFLEAGERAELRVRVDGLGTDSADLVGDNGETFFNINLLG